MKTQQAQVIMLPTDKAENSIVTSADKLWYFKGYFTQEYLKTQNKRSHYLYFISDEPIKEGNNIYNTVQKTIFIADEQFMKLIGNSLSTNKKIIATTNPDFWQIYGPDRGPAIPKIDTTFIEVYIREEGKIDTVLLEYKDIGGEEWMGDDHNGEPFWNEILQLKLKPNGSVTVHPVKEKMYTKEEVTIVLNKALDYNRYTEKGAALKKTWIDIKNK